MNKPVKTKLCWNCEGSVSRTIENCPYCGVYLSPEGTEEDVEETVEAATPYTPKSTTKEVPQAPYIPKTHLQESSEAVVEAKALDAIEDEPSAFKDLYLPVLFLSTGAISLIFALLLLLFSTDGKLTLQWNQDLWPVFAVIAVPLLLLGIRQVSDK